MNHSTKVILEPNNSTTVFVACRYGQGEPEGCSERSQSSTEEKTDPCAG